MGWLVKKKSKKNRIKSKKGMKEEIDAHSASGSSMWYNTRSCPSNGSLRESPEISLWHFHGIFMARAWNVCARTLSRVTKTLASPDIKRLLRSWLATRIYNTRKKETKNERVKKREREREGEERKKM